MGLRAHGQGRIHLFSNMQPKYYQTGKFWAQAHLEGISEEAIFIDIMEYQWNIILLV